MRVNRFRQELAAVYRKPYVALGNPSVTNRAGLARHVALACVLEVRHLRFLGFESKPRSYLQDDWECKSV